MYVLFNRSFTKSITHVTIKLQIFFKDIISMSFLVSSIHSLGKYSLRLLKGFLAASCCCFLLYWLPSRHIVGFNVFLMLLLEKHHFASSFFLFLSSKGLPHVKRVCVYRICIYVKRARLLKIYKKQLFI